MLHLIERIAQQILPAALHRAALQLAHRVRHRWRRWRKTPICGISVILTNETDEILLLKHSYGPQAWALPGGGMKAGEDPEECARREIREELGAEMLNVHSLGTLEEELSGSPHTSHVFTGVAASVPKPDEREVVEARFFPADALPDPLGGNVPSRLEIWKAHKSES